MKKIFSSILLLTSLHIFAQEVVWLSPTEHDFGEFEQFDIQTVEFKFRNDTGAPLIVDNVRTTCGCTSPNWNREPIEPDSTASILIEYDARKVGYFYKKAKVYFSGIKKGVNLLIEGEVVEKE